MDNFIDTRTNEEKSARKAELAVYEDLPNTLDISQYPRNCIAIIENPDRTSAVRWLFVDEDGKPRCSARTANFDPSKPRYCPNHPAVTTKDGITNGRCRRHGGSVLRGPDSNFFVAGRRMKYLPERLHDRFVEALADPDLHKLDAEIALVDAQIDALLESLGEYGGEEIFKDITEAFKSLKIAQRIKDPGKLMGAMEKLEGLVTEGGKEYISFQVMNKLIDQRRRLVLAEAKRLQLTEQFVPVSQVNFIIFRIVESIKETLTNQQDIDILTEKLYSILGVGKADLGTAERSLQLAAGQIDEDKPPLDAIEGEFEDLDSEED